MARRKKYRFLTYSLSLYSNGTTITNTSFLNSTVIGTNMTVNEMARRFDELYGTYVPDSPQEMFL